MILCIGTTPTVQRTMIFERVAINAVNRARDVRQTASGKSLNVARVLAETGRKPVATGFLGGDSGAFIRSELDRLRIDHEFVSVAARTRTCTTVIDRSAGTATELIEDAAAVDEKDYAALLEVVQRLLGTVQVVVASGTLPAGAPQGFYAECTRLAEAAGVKMVLDARGDPLRQALPARPFVVKPNRAELGETVGLPVESESQLREAIERLIDRGPQWAIITQGASPAVVSDGRQWWRLHMPRITPVSPIGSGDAFAAGLAAGIAEGEDVPQACVFAAACGAANAMTPVPGELRREDVERLSAEVRLERI